MDTLSKVDKKIPLSPISKKGGDNGDKVIKTQYNQSGSLSPDLSPGKGEKELIEHLGGKYGMGI